MVLEIQRNDHASGQRLVLAAAATSGALQEFRAAVEAESCQVISLDSSTEMPARAKALQPSLILLDLEAADTSNEDGFRVLESLRTGSYTAALPVLVVLPAGAGEDAQLAAFRRGVDDCFARPHDAALLEARLRAAVRRACPVVSTPENLIVGAVNVDLAARKVSVNGAPVVLTRKEFDLLNMLLRHRGTVVYTTQLYHTIWGHGAQNGSIPVDAHTVKVHVSSLRGKLGRDLGRKIVNLPGLGYRFDA